MYWLRTGGPTRTTRTETLCTYKTLIRSVIGDLALCVDQGAAAGLVAGEADGDEGEAGVLEDDAAGVRHVQDSAGCVGALAGDDDGGRGLPDVVVDQLQQLLEVLGVSGGRVDQQHPGRPGVVVDASGACGGHVGVVSLGPVDGGDGGREDLRGRGRPDCSGRVVADPLVHGDGFLSHTDAVDLHAPRPRVDGQLGGEVAGEVPAVGGVAADGEGGQLLAVEQPRLAGVAHPDGGQERVGRLDVAGVGAERSEEHTSELQSLMRISYAVFCLNN